MKNKGGKLNELSKSEYVFSCVRPPPRALFKGEHKRNIDKLRRVRIIKGNIKGTLKM